MAILVLVVEVLIEECHRFLGEVGVDHQYIHIILVLTKVDELRGISAVLDT